MFLCVFVIPVLLRINQIVTTNQTEKKHEEFIYRSIFLELILLMKCTHYLKDEELKLTCDETENVYHPLYIKDIEYNVS